MTGRPCVRPATAPPVTTRVVMSTAASLPVAAAAEAAEAMRSGWADGGTLAVVPPGAPPHAY